MSEQLPGQAENDVMTERERRAAIADAIWKGIGQDIIDAAIKAQENGEQPSGL